MARPVRLTPGGLIAARESVVEWRNSAVSRIRLGGQLQGIAQPGIIARVGGCELGQQHGSLTAALVPARPDVLHPGQ